MKKLNSLKPISLFFLLTFFFQINFSFGQEGEKWEKNYRLSNECVGECLVESYDGGYLLSGWLALAYPNLSYILKVDKNGEILWQKTIGNKENIFCTISDIIEDKNGYIYIYQEVMEGGIYMETHI